ncbi:hypothetical protein [Salinispora arenicola]|uniref:hypothetical protein n=1 Tax=Salinispora arenicola TaxID=168697 RepID=UPI0012BBA2F8|nr:hypothetical protein [Salinispora arenicola]
MVTIKPATLHQVDDNRLVGLAATLAGERLMCVRYASPSGSSWVNYSDLEGVHEVDMGVELATESGLVLELSWATPGREEGLALALGRGENRASSDLIDYEDVGGVQDWSSVLGYFVEEVAVAFYVHDEGSSVRPWSFRIGVSNGSSVTVALGETSDHSIRYLPDNLVVIFEEATARNYEVSDGLQSAWGATVIYAE